MSSQRRRSAARLSQIKSRSSQRLQQHQQPPTIRSTFHHLHEHLLIPNPPPTLPLASIRRLSDSTSCHTAAVVLSISCPQTIHTKRGEDVSLSKVQVGDDTNQYVSIDLWGDKARWAECLQCGDLVYWRSVKVSRWRDRVGLQAYAATKFTILERRGGWEDQEDGSGAHNAQITFAQRWRLPFAAPLWLQQHMQRLNEWVKSQHGGLLYLPSRMSLTQARQRLSAPLTPSPPRSALDNPASLPPLTVSQLLHGRLCTGLYRLPCRVRRLYFPDLPFFSPSPSLLLSSLPPLSSFSSLIYRGCQHCGVQLTVDADGIWRGMCGECVEREETLLASEQVAAAAVSWYYRPVYIQVEDGRRGGGKDVWLQLSHSVMLQLMVNMPASLWAIQEEEWQGDVQPQQYPPPRQQSVRRLSKRRRRSQVMDVEVQSNESQLHQPDPLPCSTSSDGRVLSCNCRHDRCQWLGLLCALVDEHDHACGGSELVGEADGEQQEDEFTLTLLLRVDMSLDDNAEVQERHHIVVGCSIQQY